jgi:hypothetical protein
MASVLACVLWATSAHATLLWDYSPDTTGGTYGGDWHNVSGRQNFAELLQFDGAVSIDAMDVYSLDGDPATIGTSVTVRVWSNNDGAPHVLLYEFETSISIEDAVGAASLPRVTRKHAVFPDPIDLSADVRYWIGMSGTDLELGQLSLGGLSGAFFDGSLAQFTGDQFWFHPSIGDMAFRIHGCYSFPGGGATGGCFPGPRPFPVSASPALVLLGGGLVSLELARRSVRL